MVCIKNKLTAGCIFFLFSPALISLGQTGQVQVNVFDAKNNRPVDSVLVQVFKRKNLLKEGYTLNNGTCYLEEIPAGDCIIKINKKYYTPMTSSIKKITSGQSTIVTFYAPHGLAKRQWSRGVRLKAITLK